MAGPGPDAPPGPSRKGSARSSSDSRSAPSHSRADQKEVLLVRPRLEGVPSMKAAPERRCNTPVVPTTADCLKLAIGAGLVAALAAVSALGTINDGINSGYLYSSLSRRDRWHRSLRRCIRGEPFVPSGASSLASARSYRAADARSPQGQGTPRSRDQRLRRALIERAEEGSRRRPYAPLPETATHRRAVHCCFRNRRTGCHPGMWCVEAPQLPDTPG